MSLSLPNRGATGPRKAEAIPEQTSQTLDDLKCGQRGRKVDADVATKWLPDTLSPASLSDRRSDGVRTNGVDAVSRSGFWRIQRML
jgi:hypothetical protein